MALIAPEIQENTRKDILSEYGIILSDIGYNYHTTYNIINFWLNGFKIRETLHESLTKVLDEITQSNGESNLCWQKHKKLKEEVKTNCTKYLSYFQSEYAPDCHQDIQQLSDQCFGDNSNEVGQTKIKELITKMDTEMIKKIENSLWHQIYAATCSLVSMCIMVGKTCSEIKDSKAYRGSENLQSSIEKVENGIKESESYIAVYKVPINQLSNLVCTQEAYYDALKNLKYGRRAIDFAKRELCMILSEIDTHSKSIQQSRNNHAGDVINSVIKLVGNGVQYMQTSSALLTSTALALYGTIASIQTTSIVGHALGVYWSQEELNKLNKLRKDMNKLDDRVKNVFSTIALIEQQLTSIKSEEQLPLISTPIY